MKTFIRLKSRQDVIFLTCPLKVDQPERVNMTAEEAVDEDDDIPDFKTFKVSTEDAHFFTDHANGTAHCSLTDVLVSVGRIKN